MNIINEGEIIINESASMRYMETLIMLCRKSLTNVRRQVSSLMDRSATLATITEDTTSRITWWKT